MILYHGTNARYEQSILKKGLLPRSRIKKGGNYRGKERSHKDLVYLTSTFPVAYAYSIPNIERILILKIEVDEKYLYPDEDFIERLYFMNGEKKTLSEINPLEYKDLWKESLTHFLSVCTKKIRPHQIVDSVILDARDHSYHCALGAQGNSHIKNRENELHYIDNDYVKQVQTYLELLFEKGWNSLLPLILRQLPSQVFNSCPAGKVILENNVQINYLLRHHDIFLLDRWRLNVPTRVYFDDFLELSQVHLDDIISFEEY